ncbi:MAG: ATP-binding protein [Deltaproteobacteria bacterium]|jgi:hypothetical protein|nr:ATP-binding protein [Deltaproteobacteria bacterium]
MTEKPARTFNTTGTCNPLRHYMLPALPRLPVVSGLIEGESYFVIHAPRQSGKTTCLNELTKKINSEGRYYAVKCSLATLREIEDAKEAMGGAVNQIIGGLGFSAVPALRDLAFQFIDRPYMSMPDLKVRYFLNDLCNALDRELVVFFDEADCLHEGPLIMFLSQLRDGYLDRDESPETRFPRALALVGIRNIRDYRHRVRPEKESAGMASPFNIVKRSFTLTDFTKEQIESLYGQHTEETGQIFEPDAIDRAWYWTEGQPWLVNALADDIIVEQFKNDYSRPVTGSDIDRATQNLILINPTHFDSLLERLREPRIRGVIEPVVIGDKSLLKNVPENDIRYVIELGLLKGNPEKKSSLRSSNPIYGELIVRAFTKNLQDDVPAKLADRWTDGTGLDMDGLLRAFQLYWSMNGEMNEKAIAKSVELDSQAKDRIDRILSIPELADRYHVKEEIVEIIEEHRSGFATEDIPHNVLHAFLQRAVNGGADTVQREVAMGRTRADIDVTYKGMHYLLELKINGRRSRARCLEQLSDYMDKCGSPVGFLVVFDMDFKRSWTEKLTWNTQEYKGKTIHEVGC